MGNDQSVQMFDRQNGPQKGRTTVKQASLRQSILSAAERAALVDRSLADASRTCQQRTPSRQKSLEEKVLEVERAHMRGSGPEFEDFGATLRPELAGCVQGAEWNKFLKTVWSGKERVVVHSVILPPGKNPKQMNLQNDIKVTQTKRYTLPLGQLPETVSNPSGTFEVLVEQDVVPPERKVPSHFLVVQGCASKSPWEGATQSTTTQNFNSADQIKSPNLLNTPSRPVSSTSSPKSHNEA